MTEHVLEWLNAYLDGELGGLRLHQVEAHLQRCASCRSELDSLRRLSTLLQETPPPVEFTPVDRFAANLNLRLPRRPQTVKPQRVPGFRGWLVPAGLLLAWFFVQSLFLVNTLVTAADTAGVLPAETTALLQGAPQRSLLFGAPLEILGGSLGTGSQAALGLLDQVSVLGSAFLGSLLWQAGIGLAYIVWLIAWFVRQQKQSRLVAAT
jgi:anti-sigma factor RsiW